MTIFILTRLVIVILSIKIKIYLDKYLKLMIILLNKDLFFETYKMILSK